MVFYLLANCFSSLSSVVNKYFVKNGYFDEGVKMLDITFHANFYNLVFYFFIYIWFKKSDKISFSLYDSFIGPRQFLQILLFAIPIYASAYKLLMFEKMPISYVELSTVIKPFCVFFLALFLLKEKFHPSFLIYMFIAVCGFVISNFNNFCNISSGAGVDVFKIIYFIIISAIGDITRRYYCRKWDNVMHSICVEVVIFAAYGFICLLAFNRFSVAVLFNPCTLLYAIITFSHHICVILGVQRAKTVSSLEIINFSKMVFSLLFCYVFLKEKREPHEIIGAAVVLTSIVLFNFRRRSLS